MPIIGFNAPDQQQGYGQESRADQRIAYAYNIYKPNKLVDLGGHTFGEPSYEEDTPEATPRAEWRGGRWVAVNEITAATEIIEVSFEVTFPKVNWSPMTDIGQYGAKCFEYVIMDKCPDACNTYYRHYYGTVTSRPRPTTALVGIADTGTVPDTVAPVRGANWIQQYKLQKWVQSDIVPALDTITVQGGICASGCDCASSRTLWAGGGTAGVPNTPYLAVSYDGGVTWTAVTSGLSELVTDIYASDDIVIVLAADSLDPTASTAGEIRYSTDGGVTWASAVDDSNVAMAAPLHAISEVPGGFLAVGNGGNAWISTDGVTWTQIVDATLLAATDDLFAIAYDKGTGNVLVVGADAANGLLYQFNGTGVSGAFSDITSTLPATVPSSLNSIAVIANGHFMVGGASGYLVEATGFQNGGTWTAAALSTTNTITYIAGSQLMVYVGAEDELWERNPFTELNFKRMTPTVAITGDVTGAAVRTTQYKDVIGVAFVTSAGERLLLAPCHPSLCDVL